MQFAFYLTSHQTQKGGHWYSSFVNMMIFILNHLNIHHLRTQSSPHSDS